MTPQIVFATSVVMSFLTWIFVAVRYMWPWLRAQSRNDALRPILLVHSTRFVGLAFIVPGVVSPELSPAFAVPAAYGDLVAAILALLSLAALRSTLSFILVFAFNVWGTLDLLYAYYTGNLTESASIQASSALCISCRQSLSRCSLLRTHSPSPFCSRRNPAGPNSPRRQHAARHPFPMRGTKLMKRC
jgi:hypothetical protein